MMVRHGERVSGLYPVDHDDLLLLPGEDHDRLAGFFRRRLEVRAREAAPMLQGIGSGTKSDDGETEPVLARPRVRLIRCQNSLHLKLRTSEYPPRLRFSPFY
jgi:hypothetical protein